MNAYNPVNRVAEYTQEGQELIEEYPAMTAAIAFGLGVITGLALVSLLTDSGAQTPHHAQTARRMGEHWLKTMSSVFPDTMSNALRGR